MLRVVLCSHFSISLHVHREGGQHDQLAIAYQLVLDNRILSKAASDALPSESINLATSPPKSSSAGHISSIEGVTKDSSFSRKQVKPKSFCL